jgi:octaheme c-type cytochrome (tetrathionate reductase family)
MMKAHKGRSRLLWPLIFMASLASANTADHSKFEELQQDFQSGPEVTAACLECHTEAASQIHATSHWTWQYKIDGGETLGKQEVLNNFCVGVDSNEPRCTSCHVGYGYTDSSFDFSQETAVDCLVCHDTSDEYKKFPTDAGHPNYVPKEWPKGSGTIREPVDLAKVAQSVGAPDRDNCGSCHFSGGGGDSVKHGDMDSTLRNPSLSLDVHMSEDGAGLVCQDCHTSDGHAIDGSRFEMTASDDQGIDMPGHEDEGRATCASCHGNEPHQAEDAKRLNNHAEVLACQSCHIPEYAREKATKTWWDWSTAGEKDENGALVKRKDLDGNLTYNAMKGDFIWEKNVVPEYAWFDGEVDYTVVGEKMEPTNGVYELTKLSGSAENATARIWPFKIMRGKQPFDPVEKVFITPHLFGKDADAYWKSYDWERAAAAGQEASGVNFSGEIEFVETLYHWPITHMVAPKEDTVACQSCHQSDGRLENIDGIHLPGRDNDHWIDVVGKWLVWLTVIGVLIHALLRFITRARRA